MSEDLIVSEPYLVVYNREIEYVVDKRFALAVSPGSSKDLFVCLFVCLLF